VEVAERHLLRLDERTLALERLIHAAGDIELGPAGEKAS
jgi:hypothetical protein